MKIGAPGETRTPDHLVRSQVLYPTELRALICNIITVGYYFVYFKMSYQKFPIGIKQNNYRQLLSAAILPHLATSIKTPSPDISSAIIKI